MTTLTNWISPDTMQSLGWALVHFLWEGTAIAALAASATAVVRRPSARYLIGIGALSFMLVAPIATFLFYSRQHANAAPVVKPSPLVAAAWPIARGNSATSGATQPSRSWSLHAFPWLVEVWLLGVALFSLRLAGGFILLERERRRQLAVVKDRVLEICYRLQSQIGITRVVRYCESALLQTPALIGWLRPVVFLPASALTGLSEEQLRLVIAHELAHVKRFDAFVNVFQVCVETLLFYHPAVWWLNRRIRAEREHCCDETAVALCGNAVEYARALALMEEWRSAPVFAMAANGGPLSERIRHLLGLNASRDGARKVGFGGSILFLVTALIAGNALLGIAHPKPMAYIGSGPIRQLMSSATVQPQAASQSSPTAAPTPASKPSAARNPQPAERPIGAQSYVDGMRSAGLDNLSADDLIALKIQGVTPEYVRAIHDLGLQPDADTFVGMRVQGVTPEYIQELRALGFQPDADEIIGMKVQGVTAEYVQGLKAVGIQPDADEIVGLKVQGVTPEYVRELQAAGLKVNADELVGLKVQGVTAAYVNGLRDLGLNPDSDDVIGMKVQGVTPEYIRDIRALGLNPSADEIIGMKVQGVTADYIKVLQSVGFKPNVDEVIGAKVQGITPEFIELARKHGFQNLTIDKLIELKHLGILESKGEI
jgi:beta-lactamase regulating signal transducer with metallopeptidase domain/sporulation protein YlmC with PRC-barrel domain